MQFDAQSRRFVIACEVPDGSRDEYEYRVAVLSDRFTELQRLPLIEPGTSERLRPSVCLLHRDMCVVGCIQ